MFRFARAIAMIAAVLAGTCGASFAQEYPNKPIRWVVPYPPGGTTDVLARIIAVSLSDSLGQQVIVENKPGGGNNIGTEFVINSPADGYTLLLVNPPNVMVVSNSVPAKTVAEFIAYCKANPGKVNMASSGSGTSVHLSGELFKFMTGCNMLHVPYKGAGPALIDLTAGQVDVLFDNLPSSVPHIKGNRIRALAVTSAAAEPSMPNLPTVGATVPGYEATAWFGIGVPKNTPQPIIDKLNTAVNKLLADPKMQQRLADLGGVPIAGTPQDFGKIIAAETAKWAKVVEASGAKVE